MRLAVIAVSGFGLLLTVLAATASALEPSSQAATGILGGQVALASVAVRDSAKPGGLLGLSQRPIGFEANLGQAHSDVKFLARIGAYRLFLEAGEVVLDLRTLERRIATRPRMARSAETDKRLASRIVGGQIRMRFVGADPQARIDLLEPHPARVTYVVGRGADQREFDAPTYGRVRYRDVYPGIDLVVYGSGHTVEYDLVVSPGADPRAIAIDFAGADSVTVDSGGDLVLAVAGRTVKQRKPLVYQEIGGARRPVPARYVVREDRRVSFALGAYEGSRALVIDPIVDLGSAGQGVGDVIAADGAGNSVVGGIVIPATPQTSNDLSDAFVSKFDAAGAMIWSRIFSGNGTEFVNGIALDGAGNVVVTGATNSSTFPTTAGAAQAAFQGGPACFADVPCSDAFVMKLDPNGATLFSTFLGGAVQDFGLAITTDATGNIYVTGGTTSTNFPLAGASAQTTFGGGPSDGFVAKYSAIGALLYASYLGGAGDDSGAGVAVNATTGEVTVTGETFAVTGTLFNNFPTQAPFQPAYGGGVSDAFVTVFSLGVTGTGAIACSSYLGGNDDDFGIGVGNDTAGNIYLIGNTLSSAGTVRTGNAGSYDAYVAKLNPGCFSGFAYVTAIGGSNDEIATGAGVTPTGDVYVGGTTLSSDFVGAVADEVFVTKIAATPTATPTKSTITLGTSGADSLLGLAVNSAGTVYVAGASATGVGVAIAPGDFPPPPPGGGGIVQFVGIDIRPGGSVNNVNVNARPDGKLRVAILSSTNFNAPAAINRASVTFGHTGDERSIVDCKKVKDVNRDGLRDLVCRFRTRIAAFEPTDTVGILKALTLEGVSVTGSDAVRIVSRRQNGDDDDDDEADDHEDDRAHQGSDRDKKGNDDKKGNQKK